MRSFIILLFSAVLLSSMASGDCITKDGYFRGKRVYGRVKVVDHFADFKVKVSESMLVDMDVKVVTSFPDSPGEWEFVESHADFTVQFVESFEDFSIRYVSSFPKVNKPCR